MPAQLQIFDVQSHQTSAWSGGTTTQLAIYPPDADYAERTFLWRLSSAVVEVRESTFTPLPDYDRIIAPLAGTITLTHDGGAPIKLHEQEFDLFDGGSQTYCVGTCTDFNLMMRKGACTGSAQAVELMPGLRTTLCAHGGESSKTMLSVYCVSGTVTVDGETLETGSLALCEEDSSLSVCGAGEGKSVAVAAFIHVNG